MAGTTCEQSLVAVRAGLVKSGKIGMKMSIAVVDAGANLKAFIRMDGAWLGSIVDVEIMNARAARLFDMPLANVVGEMLGAIGVSDSPVVNNFVVARAAA